MEKRFLRNIGLLTEDEQNKLGNSTVSIAGIGGVGGLPAERLSRIGVGRIKILDPEVFSETDINRQFGAAYSTIGMKKVDVIESIIKDINPGIKVDKFYEGLNEVNVDDFLCDTNVVIDAIEFFEVNSREVLYRKAREKNITILLSGAVGFGAPLFVFNPDKESINECFKVFKNNYNHIPMEKLCPEIDNHIGAELRKKILNKEHHIPA